MRRSILAFCSVLALAGCGSGTLDLSGYPDASREKLYQDGRLGGDKGLTDIDLRKAWQSVFADRNNG
jgi:hypothetical protein